MPSNLWPTQQEPQLQSPAHTPNLLSSSHTPHRTLWSSQPFEQGPPQLAALGLPSPLLLPRGHSPAGPQQGQHDRWHLNRHSLGMDLGQAPMWPGMEPQGYAARLAPSSPPLPKPHLHTILQGLRRCRPPVVLALQSDGAP